jgi:spore coat protein U-like protein
MSVPFSSGQRSQTNSGLAHKLQPDNLKLKGLVMFTSNTHSLPAVCILMLAIGLSAGVLAEGGTSNTIPVTATVPQSCIIRTTGSLVFGTYDPVVTNVKVGVNATGQVSVACSKGSSGVYIGLDNGAHSVSSQRNMVGQADPSSTLKYNLYKPPASPSGAACSFPGTLPWTNVAGGTLVLPTAPSREPRLYNVCGTIPGGQNVASGSYSDVVTASVNF